MEFLNPFHVHLLHPRVIHFPIALFVSAMGLELLSLILKKDSLHRTALDIYILATIITPFVVLTGLQEAEYLHLNHPVLTIHRNFGFLTMWTSLISLPVLGIVHKQIPQMFKGVFLFFLLIIAIFVTVTGHNGGRMVYEYGVGMEEQ